MITVLFKVIEEGAGHSGSKTFLLLGKMFGPEVLNEKGKPNGWHMFNVEIMVFPSLKTVVKAIINTWMALRPNHGILAGKKITDREAMESALGEMGFHWLSQKRFNHKLVMPNIGKFVGKQEFDSCMDCRWHRQLRMGSDEMDFDFSDEDGLSLRDMKKGRGAYQPEHACLLFGTFLEEQWEMLDELNRIIEGGIIRGSVVNLNGGFGVEPKWVNLQEMVMGDLEAKACLFHRQTAFTSDMRRRDTTQVIRTQQLGAMTKALGNPFERREWKDMIPVGWMPRTDSGLLIPGAIEITSPTLNWEVARNVQPSLQVEPKRLQDRNSVRGHTEQHAVQQEQLPASTADIAERL